MKQMPGYSLIELMVTVVIIAILSVVAYPSLNQIADRENLVTAKNEFRNCYLQARAYARAPRSATASSYSVIYSDTGCQVMEHDNGLNVVSEYQINNGNYRFTDLSGSNTMTIIISTDPPYSMSATDSNGPITGSAWLLQLKDLKTNQVSTVFINTMTGVIFGDV